jgi:hypothetical protein
MQCCTVGETAFLVDVPRARLLIVRPPGRSYCSEPPGAAVTPGVCLVALSAAPKWHLPSLPAPHSRRGMHAPQDTTVQTLIPGRIFQLHILTLHY